ncbi:hypothetical protein HMPREF9126_0048 [Parvimonas sp. oral taxon 110 str. F0139]|nr:hypothetical protein HMPREF9126_0048 [Parvimonas sp. oral taxon 110 str. F0139]
MKKRRGILPNAKEHLGLVILIIFVSLFLVKNMFFNKNLNKDIMVLENPKTYDLNLSSKALVIKDEYLYYVGKSNIEVDNSKVGVDKEIGEVDVSKIDQNFKDYLAEKVQALQEQEDNKESKVENIDLDNILKYVRDKDFSKTFDILSSDKNKNAFGKNILPIDYLGILY